MAVIEHPPGDETRWDWAELPDPPAALTPHVPAHQLQLTHATPARGLAGR